MARCTDCGFISLRNRLTGDLDEMDADFRKTGNPPHRELPAVGGMGNKFTLVDTTPYRHVPICFAMAVDLGEDRGGSSELRDRYRDWSADSMLGVIIKERPECEGKFTEWRQGSTPKEHREMLDRKWMMDRQQIREDEDRQYRERQRKDDRKYRLIELGVIGIIGVLAAGAFTILGAFIERGSWP